MRYLITDETYGLFLGTQSVSVSETMSSVIVLFSKTDPFGIRKAFTFDSEIDAHAYIERFLRKGEEEYDNLSVIKVPGEEKYMDFIEVIKAGYGRYVEDMINSIPMISEEIH